MDKTKENIEYNWQSRGHGFDPRQLHQLNQEVRDSLFFCIKIVLFLCSCLIVH